MDAFLINAVVIFIAELGDKSQLMALAFATRFWTFPVLIGIAVATAAVHGISVMVGAVLGAAIPSRPITIAAAVAFIGFGLWTLRGDELRDEDEQQVAPPSAWWPPTPWPSSSAANWVPGCRSGQSGSVPPSASSLSVR